MIATNPDLMGGHIGNVKKGQRRPCGRSMYIGGEWVRVRDVREQVEKGWHAFWARRRVAPPASIDFREVK